MHPSEDAAEAPLSSSQISNSQKLLEMVLMLSVGVREQEVRNVSPLSDGTVPMGGVSSPPCNLSVHSVSRKSTLKERNIK